MLFIHIFILLTFSIPCNALVQSNIFENGIYMPAVKPTQHDQYLCTAKKLDSRESFIVQYEAHSLDNKAHHILLFGCSNVSQENLKKGHWECMDGSICDDQKIMFAWAKNAPPTKLPQDVGYRTGADSGVNYLVLEVHYAHALNESDSSGLSLYTTYERQKYIAGIFLLLSSDAQIPPMSPKTHADINCLYSSKKAIHPFAYRVHAHSLGVVISGYKYNVKSGTWTLLGKGNPNWPQAFYPMDKTYTVKSGDYLAARCTYNSTGRERWTYIGSTADDEMCNFYIMYYTSFEGGSSFGACTDAADDQLVSDLPFDSDIPLPRNPLLEEHAHGGMGSHHSMHGMHHPDNNMKHAPMDKKGRIYPGYSTPLDKMYSTEDEDEDKLQGNGELPSRRKLHHGNKEKGNIMSPTQSPFPLLFDEVTNWPSADLKLGQVSAVSIKSNGHIVLFHRGDRVWDARSFDLYNNFADPSQGPITADTVVELDENTGKVINSWGSNYFYMPHGLTVDKSDNVWVTDVALHQVMKFPAGGAKNPLLVLGIRFESGNDDYHFCKPSSIAVISTGEFFIADGYCNNRVLKYSASGKLKLQFGKKTNTVFGPPPAYAFAIPHKLTLAENKDMLYVADRENGRIQCFSIANGTFHYEIKIPEFGSRLFAVAYTPANSGFLVAVNGPENYQDSNVQGFVIDLDTHLAIGAIKPSNTLLQNPHDIAVSINGANVYISEIGPNRIWKFVSKTSTNERMKTMETPTAVTLDVKIKPVAASSSITWPNGSLTPTLVIIALLAIPILIVILLTVIIRLRKHGNFQSLETRHIKGWMSGYPTTGDKFNLGNFLHPHKGFDRVNLEESDAESSDSEVEEFNLQKA